MARIAFSFSNSMGSVPWGSDPGISEKHEVVGNLASLQSPIENLQSEIGLPGWRKLADAPDLGFRNHRFQNFSFRFKREAIYDEKTRSFTIDVMCSNDE
jgi:hypothetical protein